jgi:type II secretory pathway pseudopilin PulG
MVIAHAPRKAHGFLLVDVLVASVLLATALAVILGLASRSIGSQRMGHDVALAAMLADEQLQLVLARGPDDYASTFPTSGQCDVPFERFSFEVEVLGEPSGGGAYDVVATIRWAAGGALPGARDGSTREISVATKIAPREGDEPNPDRRPPEATERTQ